ncbi:hypothetical protein [Streptomyces sp. YIM 98790]|uniref:hypothetical protein n=1 Tax=Streptomyces sp. YIM 98790 TaxID=2689077 RepID=UPI00140A4290|nr:hypothetical protein [Streptomyces sp. YIM 98790]
MTTAVIRLVTHVDLDPAATDDRQLSVSARLEAVLADGRTRVLLDDRGWGSSLPGGGAGIRAYLSVEEIEATARTVTGPDEPAAGETHEQTAAAHWRSLAAVLERHGVAADPRELQRLPHDVTLGNALRARVS